MHVAADYTTNTHTTHRHAATASYLNTHMLCHKFNVPLNT